MKAIQCGVPQGSVIGPLLFTVFTNDMTEVVKNPGCTNQSHSDRMTLFGIQCRIRGTLTQYADDSTYMVGDRNRSSNQRSIRRCLDELEKYLNDNCLVLNPTKTSLTESMIAQKRSKTTGQPPSLTVRKENGEWKTIYDAKYTRILGANIENNMGWNAHMETGKKALLSQCRKLLGQLRHNSKLIPKSCRRNIVNSLLISKLTYLMPPMGIGGGDLYREDSSPPQCCGKMGHRTWTQNKDQDPDGDSMLAHNKGASFPLNNSTDMETGALW